MSPQSVSQSVQLLSCVQLFAIPWTTAPQASLSVANSRSWLQLMSIELVMPSNHRILDLFEIRLINVTEKAMAPHSSTLAWKIPWMEEPGRLQSMGSHRVRHDWITSLSLFTFPFHALEKEMATHSSVLAWRIPGMADPGGLPSMGSHRVRHDWIDLAVGLLDHMLKIYS